VRTAFNVLTQFSIFSVVVFVSKKYMNICRRVSQSCVQVNRPSETQQMFGVWVAMRSRAPLRHWKCHLHLTEAYVSSLLLCKLRPFSMFHCYDFAADAFEMK